MSASISQVLFAHLDFRFESTWIPIRMKKKANPESRILSKLERNYTSDFDLIKFCPWQ